MERIRILFNAVMALLMRVGLAVLAVTSWDLPYTETIADPYGALDRHAGYAGAAIIVIGIFGSLVLSGIYIFVRGLMGKDVLGDPALWREEAVTRQAMRFALFLAVLPLWLADRFDYAGFFRELFIEGSSRGNPEFLGVVWMVLTGIFGLALAVVLFSSPPPLPHPDDLGKRGPWFAFLTDWIGRGGGKHGGGSGSGGPTILADVGGGGGGDGGGGP